jgi:hypothetical protein
MMDVYHYKDATGQEVGRIARIDDDDGGKTFRASHGFPVPRPLYCLDELTERADAPVLVVEGEKTAEAARVLFPEYVVTTSPFGAKSASKADWSPLEGRDVTIWPDNDRAGADYAADVAAMVPDARVVSVPTGFEPGWDLADKPPAEFTNVLGALLEGAAKPNGHIPSVDANIGAMSPIEYAQKRAGLAKAAGVALKFLDKEYDEQRRKLEDPDPEVSTMRAHWEVEPSADKVVAGELFDAIADRIESHVVLSKEALLVSTAWSLFTWFHDECVHSPQLLITSPAPECGKSTLLGILKFTTLRGFTVSDTTSPPVFRAIELWHPTLLLDEADHAFRSDPDMARIFNSGWTRGSGVLRCHPETLEPVTFDTFTPKAIGAIGLKMPPATLSRSIIIRMERKLSGQDTDDFMYIDDEGFKRLRSRAARFAAEQAEAFRNAAPEAPAGFTNRLWANWRPLLIIADLCGKGEEFRKAAEKLATRADSLTIGVVLIGDMISIMERRNVTELHSETLLEDLHAMEDRPWNEWGTKIKKPMSKHQLAAALRPFDIEPGQMKLSGLNRNGYQLEALKKAHGRYGEKPSEEAEPPIPPFQSSRALNPLLDKGLREIQSSTAQNGVELQKTRNPLLDKGLRTLELQTAPPGADEPAGASNGHGHVEPCAHCGGGDELGNPVWFEAADSAWLHGKCRGGYRLEKDADLEIPDFLKRKPEAV